MLMQCTETKKFIKINIDAIQAGDEDAPIWILVEDEEEASHDPGWIGEDHSMTMIMFCKENYGSGSFTCYTPEADKIALEKYRQEQDRLIEERVKERSQTVHVLGGHSGMGKKIARTLAMHQVMLVDSGTPAVALDEFVNDFDGDSMLFRKGRDLLPKQKGYQPNRKQMRAMNKQVGKRGRRR